MASGAPVGDRVDVRLVVQCIDAGHVMLDDTDDRGSPRWSGPGLYRTTPRAACT